MAKLNRRNFVASSMAGVAGTAAWAKSRSRIAGANDRITVGAIGTGGMGRADLRDFIRMGDVDVAAVCDVWDFNRTRAAEMSPGSPRSFSDFRRVLDLDEIDAVIVATPDHWHAPITIAACDAGKDVYVEKPLALTIEEGRKMVEAARRNKRVVQMGTQQRSGEHYQEVVELVQGGKLGKITRVSCWNYDNSSPRGIGDPPDSDPPPGLDWNMYLGPAPEVAFNPNRFIYYFRWFWDYSGGKMTDWGTHHMDIVHWAMGVKGPQAVSASGGKFVLRDNRQTPDTLEVIFEYPGFIATYSHREVNGYAPDGRSYGIQFFGTDGSLFVDRSGYEILPETSGDYDEADPPYLAEVKSAGDPSPPWERERAKPRSRTAFLRGSGSEQHLNHVRDFVDCVKSRAKPRSDVEIGHTSTAATHLANIALHTGRKIHWDAEKEEIIGDREASRRLSYRYRRPWRLG